MKRLAGRRIIVTGAASGIGAATARLFAAHGARVATLDRDATGLEAAAQATPGLFDIACDLTSAAEIDAAVAEAARRMGGLDGVVNCAGKDLLVPFEQTDAAMWRSVFDINVLAPMMLCRRALEEFSGPASIVNVSSGAGLKPLANRTAYCASKAAIVMATKALAIDAADRQVRANVVCPGVIDTPMLRASWEAAEDPDAAYREIISRNVLSRVASADEVAAGILYLISDEAGFVTGTTLTIDGGRVFH